MRRTSLLSRGNDLTFGRKLRDITWGLVLLICMIASVGFIQLYSAAGGDIDPWADRQMLRFAIGLCVMTAVAVTDIRIWMRSAYLFYAVALILLVAVELFGRVGMGAQRWLDLGFVHIQPSEIMKISIVLALARYFHGLSFEEVGLIRWLFIPLGLVVAPVLLVMKQPDLGTAMLLLAMSMGTLLKDSPVTIQEYWKLSLRDGDSAVPDKAGLTPGGRIPALTERYFAKLFTRRLSPVDTLGTVLTTIIELAAQGALFPKAERTDFAEPADPDRPRPDRVPFSYLYVRIYAPQRAASIRTEINMQWQSELLFGDRSSREMEALSGKYWLAEVDYLEIRQFTHVAILTIGESLR